MAAATDIRNTLADRLWVLFEAQTTITAAVPLANRDKGTGAGWLRKAVANLPRDQRRLEISFGPGRNSMLTGRTGFAQEETAYVYTTGEDVPVTRQFTAIITYREVLPTDPGAHPIQEAIEQTLFLAGPTLGLTDLIPGGGVGELTFDERETREGEFPPKGRITTYKLPITTIQSAIALSQETV